MKVPKGESFHHNRHYQAGDEIPEGILPKKLIEKWKDMKEKLNIKSSLEKTPSMSRDKQGKK